MYRSRASSENVVGDLFKLGLLTVGVGIARALVLGITVMWLWAWFIAPWLNRSINYGVAVGMALFVLLITDKCQNEVKTSPYASKAEIVGNILGEITGAPIMYFCPGWLLHVWMG